ncbi:unnamed protein product [Brassicogethes aeneus]|uniref:Uncharacterized protein n=1 Tax=Brassicogethes aeneus TaxID=1431903 RepID=A0A9P0AUN1_BRAAE|nr:unnamed protein product [Brassicogethes aeneus]
MFHDAIKEEIVCLTDNSKSKHNNAVSNKIDIVAILLGLQYHSVLSIVSDLPEGSISQLEVVGSKTTCLEDQTLAGCQVQALILTNNHLQHVADRAFR